MNEKLIVINIIFIRDQTKRREEIAINDARRQRCKAEKKAKDACKTGHFLILYKTPS